MKYVCPCGYVYDPEIGDPDNGVAPGTAFEDLPDDWTCPTCGLGKDMFEPENYSHEKTAVTGGFFCLIFLVCPHG